MFDIGIFELLVVGGVGLVVIGPERLPGAIRTGALWIGRVKRSLLETRREIEQHIGADDIRRELHNEEVMASLEKLRIAREQLQKDINAELNGTVIEQATPPLPNELDSDQAKDSSAENTADEAIAVEHQKVDADPRPDTQPEAEKPVAKP